MLVCIVITCGYESIISSFITVPPPFIIFTNLQDLLDNGFKILTPTDRSSTSEDELRMHNAWKNLFEVNNITSHELKSSLITIEDLSYKEIGSKLAGGNITHLTPFRRQISRYELEGKGCYFAPETEYVGMRKSIFSGFDGWKLYKAMSNLSSSGIYRMYQRFSFYIEFIILKSQEAHFQFVESQPKAFVISDMKISSIFIVWSSLVGLACVIFIAEYSREKVISTIFSVTAELKLRCTSFIRNLRILIWPVWEVYLKVE